MSNYEYITKYTSRNQTPAHQSKAVFGLDRKITAITIHHWGSLGQKFQNVVNFLCTNHSPTSAHYVVEDGKVACIVAPANVAWHSGNARGNATTIGIELRPEATAGDYATAAQLIRELRDTYGELPLRPHKYWKNTACPGKWDLNKLDRMADALKGKKIEVKPSSTKPPVKYPVVKPTPKPVAKKGYPHTALPAKNTHTDDSHNAWVALLAAVDFKDKDLGMAMQKWLRSLGYYPAKSFKLDGQMGKYAVQELQKFLKSKGLYKGAIDGGRGAMTVKAEIAYLNSQRAYLK